MIAFGPGATRRTCSPANQLAEQPLPADGHECLVRGGASAHASGSSAATGASSQPWLARQASGTASTGSGSDASWADLAAPFRPLDVHEDGPAIAAARAELHARVAQQVELVGRGRLRVDADDRPASAARAGPPSGRCTTRRRRAASRAGSSSSMSRLAAPTTRTAGSSRAGASVIGRRGAAGGPTVYLASIRSPSRDRSRRVLLRASRR